MDSKLYVDIEPFIHKHLSRKAFWRFPLSHHRIPTATSINIFFSHQKNANLQSPSTVVFSSS